VDRVDRVDRRLYVPLGILFVTAAGLAVLWLSPWIDRDERNFITVPVVAGATLLLGGWFLRFSAARPLWRAIIAAVLAVLAALPVLVRLDGYTGDMHPRLAWRWSPKRYQLMAVPRPQPPAGQTDVGADLESPAPTDYPQFLGPDRTAKAYPVELFRDWNARPPEKLWRQPIGGGWSGFAVVGAYAVTQEQRGDEELVVCYRLMTGEVVWSQGERGRFTSVLGGDGPRATPTIDAGNVYAQGAFGLLHCLSGADGHVVWSRNVLQEHGAQNLAWGRAGSPLVVDNLVIVSAGGAEGHSLVAYDKNNGELIWSAGSDVSAYASPALATLCGVRQVLIINQDWVVGHRLDDGEMLWRYPWPGNSGSNASASQAVAVGENRVFVSKGYHVGCALIKIAQDDAGRWNTQAVWEQKALLRTKLTNVVLHQGHVYGLSQGILECVELESGRRRWKKGRYGHGQIVLVGETILVSAETGEVALVEASSRGFRELTRFQAIEGKTWNNPALAGPFLLVRNDREAACYRLPLADEPAEGLAQAAD
jgi:outer membrane protein assembly factor BamB